MLKHLTRQYTKSFRGLSPEIWWLSLITLINRSGTMVIPFLTVYLTTQLHLTMGEAATIMSVFGAGSLLGTYLGGHLTDRFGYYNVMFWTLLSSSVFFWVLIWIKTFWLFCLAIFALAVVADAFRPANLAAVAAYSKPENRTRSLSLIRLAINMGFGVGPAIGGLMAYYWSYDYLFWADGLTCVFGALLFRQVLAPKKIKEKKDEIKEVDKVKKAVLSPFKDPVYMRFLLFVLLNAIVFMQLFSTIPVFFKTEMHFDEDTIGILMATNGLLIAVLEMPIVYGLEKRYSNLVLAGIGTALIGISYLIFNWLPVWLLVAILSVVLVTIGEILMMPFANAFAMNRCNDANRGQYMAAYGMSYSLAFIIAPTFGMRMAEQFSYATLWYVLGGFTLLATWGFVMMGRQRIDSEEALVKEEVEMSF